MKNGLGRYLELARVVKTVDPGAIGGNQPIPVPSVENGAVRDITPTSITSLLSDIHAAAQEARDTAQGYIREIEAANSSDTNFVIYADLARKTAFDATILLQNPLAKPEEVDPHQLAAYEQDAYRRLLDPRAPYLTDLHRIDSDASASQFAVQRVWNTGKGPHNLWEAIEEGPLMRFALYKEKQYLAMLIRHGNDIGTIGIPFLSRESVLGVVRRLVERSGADGIKGLGAVDEAIRNVRQWDLLLNRSQIRLNDDWAKFGDVLGSVMGDLRTQAAEKASRAQSTVLFGGLKAPVLESTSRIDINSQGEPIPDLSELQNLMDGEIFSLMAEVEDDLIFRDRKAIELEEARAVRQMNSRKVATAKQFSAVLTEAIKGLQGLRALSGGALKGTWFNSFSETLLNSAEGLRSLTALAEPPKISL